MHDHAYHNSRGFLLFLMLLLAGYAVAAATGWPQHGTALVVAAHAQAAHAPAAVHSAGHPPLWMVAPFVALLLGIAVLPLTPKASDWWDSNLHKFYVAAGLAAGTLLYYLVFCRHSVTLEWPVERVLEPSPSGLNLHLLGAVLVNTLLSEYIPFMTLLFALYTISGGIRIEGDLRAHPSTNALFLAVGAVLASFIGTTGAAMLLVRPLLDTNRERRHVKHTVVFFIFVVCNCGGLLLPLGDPPLFLGYLLGVPFLWTLRLWPAWLLVNGLLILVYYLYDRLWFYPREEPRDISRDETRTHALRIGGVWPNALLLAVVIAAIGLLSPSKAFPGTSWHPWLYLREAVLLLLVLLSLTLGSMHLRAANRFSYHAIIEVAALFLGIFVCMHPPLQILHVEGPALGLTTPAHFFWATGGLSSFLDNAPTYVVFFETARSLGGQPLVAGVQQALLAAVSLGAVFMGAMTYIGNGPNFMVKTIAEKSGVAMPSFFGYMVYSCLVLLPLCYLVDHLLLRG